MTDTIRIPVGPSGKPVAWATIDIEEYERVIIHRWYMSGTGLGYAFAPNAVDGKSVFLHGFIVGRLDEGDRLHVDHINRDQLDNRKANLRVVSVSENILNSPRFDGREEKVARVRALRAKNIRVTDIAVEVGVAAATVLKWTPDHPPREIRGAKGGTTYRAVETGIYARQYKSTGIVLDGFFVGDLSGGGLRWVRFETLEEAREYRASGVWRRVSRLWRVAKEERVTA